tara:strand:- start:182 stop:439 length:258 start_codon:yes stop_codon:yes gene_type:complete
MVRLYRFGNIPHIYGNFTHESNIVNAMDSFLDSLSSIRIGFFLGGEHAALEAELVVIVSGGEEHWSLDESITWWFEPGVISDNNF